KPGATSRRVTMPGDTEHYQRFAHRAAFSGDGQTLAVGMLHVVKTPKAGSVEPFFREERGQGWLFDLTRADTPARRVPQQSLSAEGLAFDPNNANRLAVAGGDDHEVQLWDARANEPVAPPIRSPGKGLWGVQWDPTGQYIKFQQERNTTATHPNVWG